MWRPTAFFRSAWTAEPIGTVLVGVQEGLRGQEGPCQGVSDRRGAGDTGAGHDRAVQGMQQQPNLYASYSHCGQFCWEKEDR